MIRVYPTSHLTSYPISNESQDGSGDRAHQWLHQFQFKRPSCVCVLGFTKTALIPGISAAGATPCDRQTTALADAEFLYHGPTSHPTYPLPPLTVGVSPTFISRAVLQAQTIPLHLFNAGLPHSPTIPCITLGETVANCVSSGQALLPDVVQHLFQAGLTWGEQLAAERDQHYLVIGECVVGGTTTALAVLTGLGQDARGKVNSSHPTCNHQQKWEIVSQGLNDLRLTSLPHPVDVVAAVGDPMQPVVAGMAIAASRTGGVLLAGGTQMLAVYRLIQAWVVQESLRWNPDNVVVGTTRWVADDPTGDTVGLAKALGVPLLATQLHFRDARYPQLRAYEQGFVKEGVAAGGCAIAAALYQNWTQEQLLGAIETLIDDYQQCLGDRSVERYGSSGRLPK